MDKDIGVVDNPVIYEPDISLYLTPYLNEKKIREQCENLLKTKGDKFCFAGIGFSMFERLWSYTGMEDALIYMITEKEFVHELLDKICEFNLKVIDIYNEYPFDGIYFGDDWGQQKGLIMGPEHWRRFIKPRMAKMYAKVKEKGKYVIQHSCGDCHEILPDLIEIGLDCYQTFQPEIYDIEQVKRLYGDKLTFWGGISTQACLPYATVDEVKKEAKRIADVMRKNGGYIIAPTHAIAFDVPPQNIMSLAEVFKEQEKYL